MSDWSVMQEENRIWALHNFPNAVGIDPVMGMVEELGELCHSILKRKQGIRGTAEQHTADIRDALGDVSIYSLHVCSLLGLNMETVWSTAMATSGPIGKGSQEAALHAVSGLGAFISEFLRGGTTLEYHGELRFRLGIMFRSLNVVAATEGVVMETLAREVWNKVRKRDWIANPADANKVADATD